jgi:hypothetical protein
MIASLDRAPLTAYVFPVRMISAVSTRPADISFSGKTHLTVLNLLSPVNNEELNID